MGSLFRATARLEHEETTGIMKAQDKPRRFFLVVLFAACLIQLYLLWGSYLDRMLDKLSAIRGYNAVQRSAIIHEGFEFAGYMDFLSETIPLDAKVILPPHQPPQILDNFGFVEYFLMPRQLHNCGSDEVEACVLRMTGEDSYIIVAGSFPPAEVARQVKTFIPYKNGLGVYAPRE
jgi:hypothetical protein